MANSSYLRPWTDGTFFSASAVPHHVSGLPAEAAEDSTRPSNTTGKLATLYFRYFDSKLPPYLFYRVGATELHPHQPGFFVLLGNFWLSHVSASKVLRRDPLNTRLHNFGTHCHWRSASPRLCRRFSLNRNHLSSSLPFRDIILFSCVYIWSNVNGMFVERAKDSCISWWVFFFQCTCFGNRVLLFFSFFYFFLYIYFLQLIVPIPFMGNLGCFSQGKQAATELHHPTYGACWVFSVSLIHRTLAWTFIMRTALWLACDCTQGCTDTVR